MGPNSKSPCRARNIWIISKYASPAEFGFETRHFALARKFGEKSRKVLVISSDSSHLASFPKFRSVFHHEIWEHCEVLWIKTLKYKKTVSVRRILSWLDFELKLLLIPGKKLPSPDVIIVSSLSLLTILNGVRLRRKFGCKLVFEIRDIWPLTLVEVGGLSERNIFVKCLGWVERFGYRKSDIVVGTMPNLSPHVSRVSGRDISCECIPLGFDPAQFVANEPAQVETVIPELPEGKFVIGYAGSIGRANALETAIASAQELADDNRIHFVFLGDGDLRAHYIEQTRKLGNVTFLPKVKRDQVQSVLRQCHLLYFAVSDSQRWEFGMSLNKLIDYMMAARPILASYSGYQSMVNEADCGEFVPANDVAALSEAVRRYAGLPRATLVTKGKAGRQWLIDNRRWDVLADKYLAICDNISDRSH